MPREIPFNEWTQLAFIKVKITYTRCWSVIFTFLAAGASADVTIPPLWRYIAHSGIGMIENKNKKSVVAAFGSL